MDGNTYVDVYQLQASEVVCKKIQDRTDLRCLGYCERCKVERHTPETGKFLSEAKIVGLDVFRPGTTVE